MLGRPPGTGPSVATPWLARSHCQLTKIEPITAMSAPGIFGVTNFAAENDHEDAGRDRHASSS